MKSNYSPPQDFHITQGLPRITPEEFDTYRYKQDPLADRIAESIYQFSLDWATHHGKQAQQMEETAELNRYKKSIKKAQRKVRHSEQAFEFFRHMEKAISNPHPPDPPGTIEPSTPYRYKWDQETLDLAKELGSDAIDLLDVYFDDTRKEENDPFAFLFTEEVQATIERGAKIFEAYGTNVIAVLAVRSLLKQYAAFNASNVLVSTKFLTRFPHRRIFETMQFLIDIVTPGNLRKDGIGIIAIKKLRLVHALVRHRIKINDDNINQKFIAWNSPIWGDPINQQDMIFAVHTFSIEIIRGLQKAGYFLDLSEVDRQRLAKEGWKKSAPSEDHALRRPSTIKEDYYLAWHYIGKALGVMDEINPTTYEDGWKLQQYIYHTQFRLGDFEDDKAKYPNLTSPVLAEPLINFIIDILPFTDKRQDALAVVAFYNDEKDYDPIFRDILGLDVKGLADHDFQDFVSGSLNIFDRFLEIFYKVKPQLGVGKPVHVRKIGALNRSLFLRLRKMSINWKGSHFTLRDGLDNKEGLTEQIKRGNKKIGSIFAYLVSFVFIPFLFIFLKPISRFAMKRISKIGHKKPRLNFNNDSEHFHRNAAIFCDQFKHIIEDGRLHVNEAFMNAAHQYTEEHGDAPAHHQINHPI